MTVGVWSRHGAASLAGCFIFLTYTLATTPGSFAAAPVGPSDRPEAYFNGSSYIRLSRPISLKQLVGLSFRTCVGGELFSQRFEGYTLHVTALYEQVVVSWARPAQPHREVGLVKETLDNRWHWVALRYKPNPPSLLLEVDRDTQVISNVTWNPELLSPGALEAGGAVVLVGNVFSGCIHEGPQLEFHAAGAQLRNVVFGNCPLTTDECIDRKDVLRIPPKDHCYNEPCMRHGTCISRHDRYECHCTARYTGNNCEVDAGDPCASAACRHGARCVEDGRGDYSCDCPPGYHGTYCELEVSLDPLCVAGPCRNNGSCSVPPGGDTYLCTCPPGYTGRNCETDVDECSGAAACLNGGRCVDAVNNYTCDCTATGYTGARCETNVNECEEDRALCGHGVCYDTYGGFVCACQPGYTGEHCHRMSACASGPCGAGGACVEEGGGFRCVCARGYLPPLCAAPAPPSPCADLACPPRSHCSAAGSSTTGTGGAGSPGAVPGAVVAGGAVPGGAVPRPAVCICDVGYYGAAGLSPNCSRAESACEAGVCLNGASCEQGPDHFNCSCAPGYRGPYCEMGGRAAPDPQPERCAAGPCLHALSCVDLVSGGFRCECGAGWGGARCEMCEGGEGGACEDCRSVPCPPHQECVEVGGAYSCAAAEGGGPCGGAPCHNGTCTPLDAQHFTCACSPGYNGRYCETDVDECAMKPKICNNGVCVNTPGSYQCYCRPGYTGDSCEQDIDECLSSPCKNSGTCQNLENNYECVCMEGFEGKDCSVNIDECEASPCAAGSTCVDGVASYSCQCQEGLTGPRCEVDIDDCESQPCQHGGRCVDALNGYSCECGGTGFTGDDCSVNIDECAPAPCRHGATCVDELNDYRCSCHPGFTGKNCEVDINECEGEPCKFGGVCLERSNASLYLAPDAPPVLVGPHDAMLLPPAFYQPFAIDDASGFECVCVPGTAGARCELNIDECASSPCGHGKCVDGVGSYSCDCLPGYEGDHCEIEIDECQRYQPCAHGRCVDQRATYHCSCSAGWGGRNCSVVLQGCAAQPCRNQGSCHPWLRDETEHRFNCSCANGFYGTTCEKITTMSLERSSYAEVNTSREEGYDISFRFKTTLGDGLLAMGIGLTYFFLELSNGRLNLHSSLLNKWEGVFIGSNLNDSNWQKVFVTINSSHLVLAANEEQTIYPISQIEAYNSSVTSFPTTRLGRAGSSFATLTHGPDFFVGCFQDVVVNGQWVLPESGESEGEGPVWRLAGVTAACPRVPQCQPSPCRSGGRCHDHWTSFLCTCPRPHLGDTCQYNYTAATFGHEAARRGSAVRVLVGEAARRAVLAALDISMFIRTRKPTGQIFYLGSLPRYGQTEETQVGASLSNGELLVHLRFNQTPENYTVGGTRLDNGHLHLIEVVRNSTLVQVKLNGTEYFRKSISGAKQLDAQVLYLGGPPPAPEPPEAAALIASPPSPSPPPAPASSSSSPPVNPPPAPPAPSTPPPPPPPVPTSVLTALTSTPLPTAPPEEEPDDSAYFKGVIQDVQVSNGVNVTIVEFFPLRVPGLELPPPFGEVFLPPGGVLRGVVSDDVCASQPCKHNATCTNTWNDFTCTCPRGYKGKQCGDVEFCQLQGCPPNSHCRDIDQGLECVSNATFDGANTTLTYRLRDARPDPLARHPLPPPTDLTITYRTKVGGTLLRAESDPSEGQEGSWFAVGAYKERVSVQWRLDPLGGPPADLPRALRMTAPHSHLHWTTVKFTFDRDQIIGSFVEADGEERVGLRGHIDVAAWQRLVSAGRILLGGGGRAPAAPPPPTLNMETSTDQAYEFTEGEEFAADNIEGKYFKGCVGAVHVGGLLLPFFTEEKLFVGPAAALLAAQPHYALISGVPWGAAEGVGCVLCLEADCNNGGRCADVRSSYSCSCPPGYSGDYCQVDIDECAVHECQHGATCRDLVAAYRCECPPGFEGQLCESDIDECTSSPCANGGTCVDAPGGYTCTCSPQWRGDTCREPRARTCAHSPCAPGAARCTDDPPDPPTGNKFTCECREGYEGVYCEKPFCEVTPCVHGECRADAQGVQCACAPGWTGARCSEERDECVGHCQHGGRCYRDSEHFLCDCTATGWTGARCEVDVDECAEGLVSCGPGDCRNLNGSYTCVCGRGYCGAECALVDPCGAEPCQHGAVCEQRCAREPDYVCRCTDGWAGKNCTQQAVAEGSEGTSDNSSAVLLGVGGALVALALAGGALGALGAQARRKRATRGTYSPSGQEYCNPRAEMHHHALKPPPEERLI